MKQPKRLTRIQKKFLTSKGYDSKKWAFAGVTEQTLCFMNKETGKIKEFERED
ncbi:DUF6906 family protein [Clostridium baratii]|uniref:DUF6906 family protein n=1 Tax=Clostridium baratii TaxID=1561 RepID=UPI0030D47D07